MIDNPSDRASASEIELTAHIVSAYVSKNPVPAADLPALIANVSGALRTITRGDSLPASTDKQQPAVPIKKSVTPDYLVSLEDGKKFKSLKRHLMSHYGMTPDQYRAKWGLPADYPMVAPNYSAARSDLAKTMGLGQNAKGAARRGRKKAA